MHPSLSQLLPLDKIPNEIEAIRDALVSIFDDIYIKNLIASQSSDNSSGFYSLTLTTYNSIGINVPVAQDLRLVLNPTNQGSTEIPIAFDYSWIILKYINDFNFESFDNTVKSVLNILFELAEINQKNFLNEVIYAFYPGANALEDFVNQFNTVHTNALVTINDNTASFDDQINYLSEQISSLDLDLLQFAYDNLLNIGDEGLDRLKKLFERYFNNIEENLKAALELNFNATIKEISVGLQFPQKWLQPVNTADNIPVVGISENEPLPDTYFSYLKFDVGSLVYSSKRGLTFNNIGTFSLNRSMIGKTGLIAEFSGLKIDLNKDKNIPEADADGRDVTFRGVYADNVSITLPKKWFKKENGATLQISGKQLLIGSQGGISGTILLEAIINQTTTAFEYYSDKFNFVYPVVMLDEDPITHVITELSFTDYSALKAHLIVLNTTNTTYHFKFPLSLNPIGLSSTIVFNNELDYLLYLSTLSNDFFWNKLGGDNGFRIGFNRFDITFKQNKVISSNIKGALEIKKFVYPAGHAQAGQTVHIDIEGHLHDNGDFNLTASTNPTFPIELKDVFTYDIKSLELGREGDDFYIGTAGSLQFQGFLKTTMGLGPIEIERLRIYSDGNIEFVGGGSINLPAPLVLKLGPVEITVTALHFGGHQKEVNGVMRKFNYFGFDGGISVDPLGVEIRGDGVKFYYCVDDIHPKLDPYLHIQTLYLDLTIPAKSPTAIINGWISIPEPGVSKEYAGGIKIQIPKAKISGRADMKLMPRYPAFIIDAEVEPPAPIPLGSFAIYGFRGLLGYRYVAEKSAVQGANSWYDYYKAPERGINVRKFNGPDKTKLSGTPFSIGAGASLGTSADNGTVLNIKAMVLLSIPSLFMIDGRAAVLSARLGLEDTKDPPFFAFIAIGDDSLELGFGADFKMPSKNGNLLSVYADIQAGFFFKNQHPWYVNIGTKTNPVTARIIKILTIKSYVMLSAKGIEAGARGEFNFDRKYGPISVKAHAFVEVGGQISFERPQMGAYLMAGVSAHIKVLWVHIGLDVGIMFGVQSPKPFIIWGEFYFRIRIKVWRFTIFKFRGKLKVVWNINKNLDTTPLNPMSSELNRLRELPNPTAQQQARIAELNSDFVKGVNMLSNEIFELAYLNSIPSGLTDDILNHIIPLDTYIDIKTEKNLAPGDMTNPNSSVRRLIGGVTNAPKGYLDLMPPVESLKGKNFDQVRHQYTLDHIEIKHWNGSSWQDYHPYQALYPNDIGITNMKIGQFQKTDGKYNTLRILATTPFSYTEQGQPGWNIPEQYGINPTTLFCEEAQILPKCADFLFKPLNAHYYCGDSNTPVFSNEVAFQLLSENEIDFAYITAESNTFNFAKSLAFDNWNSLEINLPQSSFQVGLKLSNFANGVKIMYYSIQQNNTITQLSGPSFGNPDPNATNVDEPFEILVTGAALNQKIEYNHPDWRAVSKIVIKPVFDPLVSQQIALLSEEIAAIQNDNNLISLGVFEGAIISTASLEDQLHQLICGTGGNNNNVTSFVNRYHKNDKLNYYYAKEFLEASSNCIYNIGTTEHQGLISKIAPNGNIIWERKYSINDDKKPFIFKRIIQLSAQNKLQYIVYATTGDVQYLLSFDPNNGDIVWMKQLDWRDKDVQVHLAPRKDELNFYLVISDRNQIDTFKNPFVSIINSEGNFVKGNMLIIDKEEFIINSISEDKNGLVLAGRYIEGEYKDSVGTVIQLNNDLEIVRSLKISDQYTTFHSIKIIDTNKYLLSGYDNKRDCVFALIIDEEGTNTNHYFPNSKNHNSSIQLCKEGFYLKINDNYDGFIHLLDYNFNLLWTKKIQLSSGPNGIRNFTFNNETEKISLNCYNQTEGSLLVYADKNLQTCLTIDLDKKDMLKKEVSVKKADVYTDKYEIRIEKISSISTILNSIVKQYCASGDCGDEDTKVCDLYTSILDVYENCLIDPTTNQDINFDTVVNCYYTIQNLIKDFDISYNLPSALQESLTQINDFLSKKDLNYYTIAWNAVQSILNYLNEIGNCICECNSKNFTLLHEVCWMSAEDYQYNINIPTQSEITADAQATLLGITKYIQPIWRPDTSYYIRFVLTDNVNNGLQVQPYTYIYGFTTAGPLGYFHRHEKATYGDIALKVNDRLLKDDNSYFTVAAAGLLLEDNTVFIANTNGFILDDTTGHLRDAVTNALIIDPTASVSGTPLKVVAHPDKYVLTSLRPYIDYNRSYPSADGNLLGTKPMFYNDNEEDEIDLEKNTTRINIFFNKTYATNFFRKWDNFPTSSDNNALDGRLKIVIKDPTEDATIENPPYLDYDEDDTDYVHIPQTTQEWNIEQNPQIPFVLSQYTNLINSPNCTGIITTTIPASEYVTIKPKHLKPSKLYTAIVNNLFDVDHNGSLDPSVAVSESREVHKFVFRTSRYKNFKEQINSFYLEKDIEGVTAQKEAIFTFEKAFSPDEINASYDTISGSPITGFTAQVLDNLNNNYQHPYDRVFEGILGLQPFDDPISTEVNIIKDSSTGNIIALIVRNPEPFNNPKFPLDILKDTIEVLTSDQYKILYSKDNSQAIIMNANKNINTNIDLKFNYKVYQDLPPFDSQGLPTPPASFYPTLKSEVLSLDLLNN